MQNCASSLLKNDEQKDKYKRGANETGYVFLLYNIFCEMNSPKRM